MSKIDELCKQLDAFASQHQIAPALLKTFGDLSREARSIEEENQGLQRELEAGGSAESLKLTQVTVNHYLCECGRKADAHYCVSGANNPGKLFKAGFSMEVPEPTEEQKEFIEKELESVDSKTVVSLDDRVGRLEQNIIEVQDRITDLAGTALEVAEAAKNAALDAALRLDDLDDFFLEQWKGEQDG